MNALPKHRRAQAGRTWAQPWSASDFDPIRCYRASRTERMAGVLLAVVMGIMGAALLVHWWAAQ